MTGQLFDLTGTTAEVDPWAQRHGVPLDVLDTPGEAEAPVDYLRVGMGVTRDRQFRAFRKAVGPAALAWWVALLVLAKRDGAFGLLDIDDLELAVEATGNANDADQVLKVLKAAATAGLIWLQMGPDAASVRIRKWREWQPKSPRERQRLKRAKERDDAMSRHTVTVTPPRDQSRPHVTVTAHDTTRQDEDTTTTTLRAHVREADDDSSSADLVSPTWRERYQPAVEALDCLTNGGDEGVRDWLYNEIAQHARRYQHAPDAYHRAAVACAKRVANGDWPTRGTPNGWYLAMVQHHLHEIERPTPNPETHTDDRRPARPRHAGLAAFD